MSVAFRRDGDEEHLEPKFELPLPPGPNLVTARGLAQIRDRVVEVETRIPGLADEAELTAARRQLRYWLTRQSTARQMPAPDGAAVAFGCTVAFQLNGKRQTITIVGNDEADPANGLLAFSAPLCRALMEAEPGDTVEFAGKPDAIEILSIEVTTDS